MMELVREYKLLCRKISSSIIDTKEKAQPMERLKEMDKELKIIEASVSRIHTPIGNYKIKL